MNKNGYSSIHIVFFIIILSLLIGGGYYFNVQKNNVTPARELNNQKLVNNSEPAPSSDKLDISGFPVYPNAIFTGTEDYSPCEEGKYSGFSICNSKAYRWNVKASYDDIMSFYKEDKSKSGWTCSGGAGSYDDSNNASGTTGCKKGDLSVGLSIDTMDSNSKITLTIPKGTPTGK